MINDKFDEMLLEVGFDKMSLYNRNQLMVNIGSRESVNYDEITEDFILEYHRKMKKEIFSDNCNKEIIDGFVASNGHRYRLNRDDQVNFMGKMLQIMNDPTLVIINWKTEDIGYLEHTKEEWLKIFNEGLVHKESILYKYNVLSIKLEEAITQEEIVSLTWDLQV